MTPYPDLDRSRVPTLTTEQMVEVDRAMIEDYGIALIQMMENAGRALALLARDRFLTGSAEGRRIVVLAGTGGNGGGALVAARRLAGWGARVHVALTKPADALQGVPAHQLDILRAMDVPLSDAVPDEHDADLVLDGIIGYSLAGAPRGRARDLVLWTRAQQAPVLSLDTPSGLDTTTGTAHDPSVHADATLTLALPKAGLAHPQTGALFLADISVPPDLYRRHLGLDAGNPFARGDIVHLR